MGLPADGKSAVAAAAAAVSGPRPSRAKASSTVAAEPTYLFGYGSLICPDSRAATCTPSAAAAGTARAARVRHLERAFIVRAVDWTAVGVRFRHGAACVGVLLPVTRAELRRFDRRELGYDRTLLRIEDVELLKNDSPMKDAPEDAEMSQPASPLSPPLLLLEPHAAVWVYVPQRHVPPSIRSPIAQSYVDIMLRGCLSISEEFARDFLLTTRGWHVEAPDDDAPDASSDAVTASLVVHWVDDRASPRYARADIAYSRRAAAALDALLQECLPEALAQRRRPRATTTKLDSACRATAAEAKL